MAEELEARIISLLPATDPDEECTQLRSVSPVSEEADTPAMEMPPASFHTDMSRLVESLIKSSTISAHQGYRKLQFFLGCIPTPAGEKEFESWLAQAMQAVEEWNMPEAVKRQKISKSLRSPAADVIRSLRRGKPVCVEMDYIKALSAVYGRVEKLPDVP